MQIKLLKTFFYKEVLHVESIVNFDVANKLGLTEGVDFEKIQEDVKPAEAKSKKEVA
jgi:hypothetical protein